MKNSEILIYDLIVTGGGAAGFFGAIQAVEIKPGMKVLILEKTNKLLSKVKVSGGGRCNVTHACFDTVKLSRHYPRGEKQLKSIFKVYNPSAVVKWFASKGVSLKTEEDGRMFPTSDDSQTIIDCFIKEALAKSIKIEMGEPVIKVERQDHGFEVYTSAGKLYHSKKIMVCTGGNPQRSAYDWIASLGHQIVSPIPSLFTFNDEEKKFLDLMGVSVEHAEVKIAGTKFLQQGPVLITHWGLSGPAVIKLSAWAAEYLHEKNYQFTVLVSWIGPASEESIRKELSEYKEINRKQRVVTHPLFSLPQRLWIRLCELSDIPEQKIWAELPQKNLNRLIEFLIRCPFSIKGKTTFKEEFVTCGGVALSEIDLTTMQSKKVQGVYFAGEVLNVDGETGGFNFQAAWSTAFLAAKSIASYS